MRDIKVIEAEISKLQAELEDAKSHELMRTSAVHILKNLGWTYTKGTGWNKPLSTVKPTIFDADSMTHVKAGDWVYVNSNTYRGYAYVRSVRDGFITASKVVGTNYRGATVSDKTFIVFHKYCKVTSHMDIMVNFNKQ